MAERDEARQPAEEVAWEWSFGESVRTAFEYVAADDVPGGVFSAEQERRLRQRMREIDEAQIRARQNGATYFFSGPAL